MRRMFDLAPSAESTFSFNVPAVDVTEDDKTYKVAAELPGLDEKDIEVSVGDVLTLKGYGTAGTRRCASGASECQQRGSVGHTGGQRRQSCQREGRPHVPTLAAQDVAVTQGPALSISGNRSGRVGASFRAGTRQSPFSWIASKFAAFQFQ